MKEVTVQSLIDHIKTAVDVDPLAKEMVEKLLKCRKPQSAEIEGGGNGWYYVCGECHGAINYHDKYCRHCGCVVCWDEK
jgi:hypothetical protein